MHQRGLAISKADERRSIFARSVDDAFQFAKERARLMGRAAARALVAGLVRQPREILAWRERIRIHERLNTVGFVQQAIAPALEQRESRTLVLRSLRPFGKRCPQRFGVHVAHQPSDVLKLASSRLVPGDGARESDGIGELLGKFERREALRIERNELFAEFLQCVHLLLAPRLRRGLLRLVVFGGSVA